MRRSAYLSPDQCLSLTQNLGRQVGKVRRVVERPNCQDGETAVYPDPTSCNNFMLCENGTVSFKL